MTRGDSRDAPDAPDHETVGLALSSFDMFHVGHLRAVSDARQRCGRLVLALASDRLVADRCGRQAAVAEQERVEVLGAFFPDLAIEVVDVDGVDLAARFGIDVVFVATEGAIDTGEQAVPTIALPYDTTSSISLRSTLEADVLWPLSPAADLHAGP